MLDGSKQIKQVSFFACFIPRTRDFSNLQYRGNIKLQTHCVVGSNESMKYVFGFHIKLKQEYSNSDNDK